MAGLLLAWLLLLAGPGAPAGPVPRGVPLAQGEEPRLASAAEELARARRRKLELFRAPEAEREERRARAIRAYEAVALHHAGPRRLLAEAWFRAGELRRAGGDPEGAARAFEQAARVGEGTAFHGRAGLELGHLARRAGRFEEALDHYLAVAAQAREAGGRRDEAWLWAGKAWLALGRGEDARRAWGTVARDGDAPEDRVAAYDLIGLSWVEEGDLEAAAGVLDECLRALSEASREATTQGRRVRNALASMRMVVELRERVQERLEGDARHRENPLRRR